MPQHKIVDDFLCKAIPKNVSTKKQNSIRTELESHINDKADFYIEIGYDEQVSYEKAIAEMGDSEEVCQQFEDAYREKSIHAVLISSAINLSDILAVILGFGASYILSFCGDLGMLWSLESIILSSAALCAVILAILYACKEKRAKMLTAIGISHLLMSVTPYFFNLTYQPFVYAFITAFTNLPPEDITLSITGSEIISVTLCLISFVAALVIRKMNKSYKKKAEKEAGYKTVAVITIIAFFVFICYFYSISHNDTSGDNDSFIISFLTDKQDEKEYTAIYNSLNEKTPYNEAYIILRNAGYIPHTEFQTVIKDEEDLEYNLQYLEDYVIKDSDTEVVFCKLTKFGEIVSDNVSIVVPNTGNSPITWKTLHHNKYRVDSLLARATSLLDEQSDKIKAYFETLNIGDSEKTTVKKLRNICIIQSQKSEYISGEEIITYEFSASESSGLLQYDYEDLYLWVSFKNGKLIGGEFNSYGYSLTYDDELEDEVEEESHYQYVIE